ncbi:hypothetical protein LAZ67_15001039 [Cordylochernes scorpioides]|uniref:Transposase n=1 Tax=Cordylochernes scorpioides TaxID=51811 RepID=A0ABY6LBZ9_9ARAC|nr:hypothetical protein LAZ67_15001039 [Cordylochernes scorpioides]
MSLRKILADDLKWRAVGRMETGQSQVEVAKWLNVNKSVVIKIWKQFIETGTIKRKEGSGRKRKTATSEDRYLVVTAKRHREMTAIQLSNELSSDTGTRISRQTVYRRLHEGALYARRPMVCIPLTSAHRRARLNWCLEHHAWTHDQWANVLFSDESRFSLNTDSRRVFIWREPGTRYHPRNIREIDSFRGGSLLVWAGISSSRRTPLHIFSGGTLTAQRCRDEILEPYLRPYRDQIGHNLIFMDVNARPHRARVVNEYLQSENIRRMDWPARSPDLNPIEHVWDALGRRIGARHPSPRTLVELRTALLQEWGLLPLDLPQSLVNSMRARCETLIAVRDITDSPVTKSRQDSGRQGTSKQIDHCLYRKMEQGREENPKEPMESDPDSESGGSPTFPKKENTLGRTQEVPPGQEDVTPPPPVSDVLGSLARTIYQLSSATGLSRDVELSRYDGSYEAQSFFDNYDAQADLAQLHYTDRLRRLPNLLQGKALHYFRSLKLDKLYYVDARQALIDLFPETTNASFAQFLAIKLTDRSSLEEYYQKKTVCGLQLNLPHKILLESLTDGLPVADQRIVAAVQPNTLQAWYSVVSRVRGTHSASQVCQQTTRTTPNPSFAPSPRYSAPRPWSARPNYSANPPPSSCRYCGAMHWHAQCPKRPAQRRPRPVYRATTYPQHDRTVLSSPAPFRVTNTRASYKSLRDAQFPEQDRTYFFRQRDKPGPIRRQYLRYDPETKRQSMEWKGKDEPRTKKSRLCKSKNKVLLVTFFDIKGIVHHEYLEEGQTINKESYLNIMRRVRESIRLKRSEMWSSKYWIIHHDKCTTTRRYICIDLIG